MRKRHDRIWLILFSGVALLTLVSIARLRRDQDRIPWRDDFAAAQKESALTHKPIFLDFTAAWCGPCQELKSSTWADTKVARALSAYIPVRVEIDAHPDLAAQFGVASIPMFITLDRAQQPKKNSVGYLNPTEFLDWLKD